MALSQVQIIRSLGEALAWFEKELAWGVAPAELSHLTGRIGELYAAMMTRGQMALAINQHGYDVVGADGERISVKTVTSSSHVTFKRSTFHQVDRVLVLRIKVDEGEASIEELLDRPAAELTDGAPESAGDYVYHVAQPVRPERSLADLAVVAEAHHGGYRILQYENGTIVVERDGVAVAPAKPVLGRIAAEVGVGLLNGQGNAKNTRQLGSDILAVLGAHDEAATSIATA